MFLTKVIRAPVPRLVFPLLALFALVLAGCATKTEKLIKEARECPALAVVAGTGYVTGFRPGGARNAGDVTYQAELSQAFMKCTKKSGGHEVVVTFQISARKGPAATSDTIELPYFVAVSLGNERVLAKQVFTSTQRFSGKNGRSAMHHEVVEFLPGDAGHKVGDYEILLGFQLAPDDLEYNFLQ